MARLSKQQLKLQEKVMDLIHSDKPLTEDEIRFCYENYNEAHKHDISYSGAFFTPIGLANDFELTCYSGKILDACAGIGMLSYVCLNNYFSHADCDREITCVEQNIDYYNIGKRLLPQANWVHADIFDFLKQNKEYYNQIISNPPFGNIKTHSYEGDYSGSEFEFKLIDAAKNHCRYGSFILPQGSSGFKYSGGYQGDIRNESDKYKKFANQTGLKFELAIGIDTSIHKDDWKNTKIITEVVDIDYSEFVDK